MGWEVVLSGDPTDLGMLAMSFTGPDLSISRQGDEYVLACPTFAALGDAREVYDRALSLIEQLNGAVRVALEPRIPISCGGVNYRHPDGRRAVHVFPEPMTMRFRLLAPSISVTRLDGTIETCHPADPVRDWVRLASQDEAVAKALSYLATGAWDWVCLYRIFEFIEDDCGGVKGIESRGWATSKAIRLFKHTANSPGAVGREARHGAESTKPPPQPMPIGEAKSLVLGIVQSWLQAKVRDSRAAE